MSHDFQDMSFETIRDSLEATDLPESEISRLVFRKSERPSKPLESVKVLNWILHNSGIAENIRCFAGTASSHTLFNLGQFTDALDKAEETYEFFSEVFPKLPTNSEAYRRNRIHIFFSLHVVLWQLRINNGLPSEALRGLSSATKYFSEITDEELDGRYFFETSHNVFRVIGAETSLGQVLGNDEIIFKNSLLMERALEYSLKASWGNFQIKREFQDSVKSVVFHRYLESEISLGESKLMVESLTNLLFLDSTRTLAMSGNQNLAREKLQEEWAKLKKLD